MASNPYVNKVQKADGSVIIDISDTTAIASDVASGKYFYTASGEKVQGTASGGGGGASNVVTGTFKGTTTGTAMDVTIPYTGNGYPIAVMIFVSTTDFSTFNSLIQRYAIRDYFMDKYDRGSAPSYKGKNSEDVGMSSVKYKGSTSNSTSYSNSGTPGVTATIYQDTNAGDTTATVVKIRSNKKMSVYIPSTSYGFAANIEYTYYVIYSS